MRLSGLFRSIVALTMAWLVGCSSSPPRSADAPAGERSAGVVIGRSDRLLIYRPGRDDTLRSIAAQFLGDESRDWVISDFNRLGSVP